MSKLIETFVLNSLLRCNKEHFKTDKYSSESIKKFTNFQLIAMIISLIISQLLLLLLGKFLWNNYLVKVFSGVNPIESVWQLLALSVLLKLLTN